MSPEENRGFYPGTATPLAPVGEHRFKRLSKTPRPDAEILEELTARTYRIGGEDRKFYTLGELAKALGRSVITVRKWETLGILPKATYVVNAHDPHAKRRLYTAEQILGIVRIAAEENILLDRHRPRKGQGVHAIQSTDFTRKVIALFTLLKKAS